MLLLSFGSSALIARVGNLTGETKEVNKWLKWETDDKLSLYRQPKGIRYLEFDLSTMNMSATRFVNISMMIRLMIANAKIYVNISFPFICL